MSILGNATLTCHHPWDVPSAYRYIKWACDNNIKLWFAIDDTRYFCPFPPTGSTTSVYLEKVPAEKLSVYVERMKEIDKSVNAGAPINIIWAVKYLEAFFSRFGMVEVDAPNGVSGHIKMTTDGYYECRFNTPAKFVESNKTDIDKAIWAGNKACGIPTVMEEVVASKAKVWE